MVADLVKAVETEDSEETSDYGKSGTFQINGADVDYQWDSTNKNYVVDITFTNWPASYELILSQDELSGLESEGITYFNENIRNKTRKDSQGHVHPYWPFGSHDHLHWPSQTGK